MTRLVHPPRLDSQRERDEWNPAVEGARHGLSRDLSLAIWEQVCADTTDGSGRRDEAQAQQRFVALAAYLAARGGRLRPDVGRVTRVGLEVHGEPDGAWRGDRLRLRPPGRETLVTAEARRWRRIDEASTVDPEAVARATAHATDKAFVHALGEVPGAVSGETFDHAPGDAIEHVPGNALGRAPGHPIGNDHPGAREVAQAMAALQVPGRLDQARRGGMAALERRELPAALLAAARRLQVPDPREAVARQRLISGLRGALVRALRDGFGVDGGIQHAVFGGAVAANDRQRPGEPSDAAAPAAAAPITMSPAEAFAGLAGQTAVAAIRRTLTTSPARLAARMRDGAGPIQLDDRADLMSVIQAADRDPGQPLPAEHLARFERELGRSLDHVRIHTGHAANAAARAINARAFTLGSHVYFADGELAPGSDRGDRLLRHELTHVIQHDEGRLHSRSGGLEVEDHDSAAEVEARAAETGSASAAPTPGGAAAAEPAAPERTPAAQAAAFTTAPERAAVVADHAASVTPERGTAEHTATAAPERASATVTERAASVTEREPAPEHTASAATRHAAFAGRAPATAVPQRTASAAPARVPAASARAGASPANAGGGVVARGIRDWVSKRVDDVGDGLSTAGGWVADRAGDVASWGADQFISVVRHISPRLAELIERGPSAVVWDEVVGAIRGFLGGLLPPNPLSALLGFGSGIMNIGSVLVGAATGDTTCCATFASWCEKLGAYARKAAKSEFITQLKSAFGLIDSAIAGVVKFFGGGLLEAFRGQLQFLDTMGSWITTAIKDVGSFLKPAADWVLKKLGLPSVDEIGNWLRDLAAKAWEKIKGFVASGLTLLKTLGPKLLEFSGLGPIIEAFKFSMELIEVTDWLISHRNDPDLVKNARTQMAHTFLPKLIDKTGGLVTKLQAMYQWVSTHLTDIAVAVGVAAVAMSGVLLPLAAVLLPLAIALKQLWPRIEPALKQLWTDVKDLAKRIYDYAKPVIEIFTQLGTLIAFPWMLPTILIGSAWLALPDCFKGPILNLILDLMIAALDAMPDSVAVFGPLWRFVKAGALGFLNQVRTQWKDPEKVTVINRLAHMASGRSPEMMAGFVVGFAKGVVAGVLDPFKMIYEILKMGWQLSVFFAKLVNHAPELAKVINKHLPKLQQQAQQIQAAGEKALDDFLHGKITFDDVWKLVTSFADSVAEKAGSLGATVADKLKAFFTGAGTEYSIGEAIGIAIGFIIVFALIVYFSGGAFAEAKGVVGAVAEVARILNMPYELMGAALKPLAKMFAPVIDALAAFGARIGLKAVWDGALKAFEGFVNTLGRLVEDILIVLERKVVGHTAEEILSILARRVGKELAERLVAELGADAADKVVAKLGEDAVKRLGTLSGDALLQLSTKLDSAAITRMLDAGWTPRAIERLGLALDKTALDSLLASGLTGPQVERLATLAAEKLQGASAATLRRLATLPEAQFARLSALGDAGFKRIIALGDTQFTRFMALGDEQLRLFSELGDATFRRFAALSDAQFARFGGMAPIDIQRFAGLSEGAFNRFAAATDDVFLRFQALPREALERFGTLGQTAFDRFATLQPDIIAKFQNVAGPALERYATAANFDVFVRAEPATIERFGELTEPAFNTFANPRFDLATLNRIGAADVAALENIATWPNGRAFNVAVRELQAAELNVIGRLTDVQAERIAGLPGGAAANLRKFGALDAAHVTELLAIADPALFARLGQLPVAELRGFTGLTAAEMQRFAGLAPDALGRFGAVADAGALRRFGALAPQELAHFSPLTTTQLAVWGQVQPATLAHFAPMEGALANFADAVPAAVLDRLATELGPAPLRELALVDAAGIRRLTALPPADLAKLNGLSGFDLQRAAQLPAGDLERITAGGTAAEVRTALQGDAAAARAQADALDGPAGARTGHGTSDHGAQTTPAQQQHRLDTGQTPGGRTHDPGGNPLAAPDEAGRWASDAMQVHASQMAEAQLPGHIAANPSTHPRGRYTLELDLQGAGYSYRLEGGVLAERQANRFLIVYEPRIQPPVIPPSTNPADYVIITMYPL